MAKQEYKYSEKRGSKIVKEGMTYEKESQGQTVFTDIMHYLIYPFPPPPPQAAPGVASDKPVLIGSVKSNFRRR